jgi:hypothetical protein
MSVESGEVCSKLTRAADAALDAGHRVLDRDSNATGAAALLAAGALIFAVRKWHSESKPAGRVVFVDRGGSLPAGLSGWLVERIWGRLAAMTHDNE